MMIQYGSSIPSHFRDGPLEAITNNIPATSDKIQRNGQKTE